MSNVVPFPTRSQSKIGRWHQLPRGFSVRFDIIECDVSGNVHMFTTWDPRVPRPTAPRDVRRALRLLVEAAATELGTHVIIADPARTPVMASALREEMP